MLPGWDIMGHKTRTIRKASVPGSVYIYLFMTYMSLDGL